MILWVVNFEALAKHTQLWFGSSKWRNIAQNFPSLPFHFSLFRQQYFRYKGLHKWAFTVGLNLGLWIDGNLLIFWLAGIIERRRLLLILLVISANRGRYFFARKVVLLNNIEDSLLWNLLLDHILTYKYSFCKEKQQLNLPVEPQFPNHQTLKFTN